LIFLGKFSFDVSFSFHPDMIPDVIIFRLKEDNFFFLLTEEDNLI